MGKKKDAREARQAAARARHEECKSAFVARVAGPRLAVDPASTDQPRVDAQAKQNADRSADTPKALSIGRLDERVSWCISQADREGAWSWKEQRDWTQEEWDRVILPPMLNFGNLTWSEIDRLASGSGHKMHHDHELSDLRDEAQDRWRDRGLEQFDVVFRFRLGGTRRIWGYVVQAHFFFVWWDRKHSIYPV